MPVVQVKEGRTAEQKRQLVERITDALVEVWASNPEAIHTIINDVPADNWGRNRMLLSDK